MVFLSVTLILVGGVSEALGVLSLAEDLWNQRG
jgi:hypothetical protein